MNQGFCAKVFFPQRFGEQIELREVTIDQVFKKTIEDPETISRLNELLGIQATYLTPEEMSKKIQSEYTRLSEVWEKIEMVPGKK